MSKVFLPPIQVYPKNRATPLLTSEEWVVEVPKNLVRRKSESMDESLTELIALGLAKSAALGTFPTESERALDLYDEAPPIWYPDPTKSRACDHEENGTRAWRIYLETPRTLPSLQLAHTEPLNLGSHIFCGQQDCISCKTPVDIQPRESFWRGLAEDNLKNIKFI